MADNANLTTEARMADTTGFRGFGSLDFSHMDDADWLRESSAVYWQRHPDKRRFARFVTAQPEGVYGTGCEPIAACVNRLRAELIELGVKATFGAYTDQPDPHTHFVIWPTRKWRHAHIRGILASVGLRVCSDRKRTIQKIDLHAQDDNQKLLWAYLARHVAGGSGLTSGVAFSFT